MDDVVVDSAGLHTAAWKALFDEALPQIGGSAQAPFDVDADYRGYVDGRAREDAIRVFLGARGVTLPEGDPGDGADRMTVAGLAAREQRLFADQLARRGVHVFPDAVRLLAELKGKHIPAALVCPGHDSAAVAEAAGVVDMFTVCVAVEGTDVALLLEAVRRVGVAPGEAVLLDGSEAGVDAGHRAGFALVVGVDRRGEGKRLAERGANVVLTNLVELESVLPSDPLAGPADRERRWAGGADKVGSTGWHLVFGDFDPLHEATREALCTLANGYWGSRGAVPGSSCDGVYYPGTYLAGVYNRLSDELSGQTVETEHRVNAPDWTVVTVGPSGHGPVLQPGAPQMLSHRQDLDLRAGVLTRVNRYRDSAGRTTRVTSRKFVSMREPHLAALEVTVEAEDWSGEVVIESLINGSVSNRNVAADEQLSHQHLIPGGASAIDEETVRYETQTSQSQICIAMAARTRVSPSAAVTDRRLITAEDRGGHAYRVRVEPAKPVRVEKIVAVATSRDRALSTPVLDVEKRISRSGDFDAMLAAHRSVWSDLWQRFGIELRRGRGPSLALNFHNFHVLQVVAAVDRDLDAGVPARGLHGEGYRGHIFWDEVYVYPMLTLRRPELSRWFLLYRYRRLNAARDAARAAGLTGAMFPWQSGSDGRDETPSLLFNVLDGQWMPDYSFRQRHGGLAVAYNVWQYYQATADVGFLVDYGAEILVEVARFFASLAVHDPAEDRYDISGVMGPDEYHDGYPDAPGTGLRNNAYTNVMTAWLLARAEQAVDLLTRRDCGSLWHRLDIEPGERGRWHHVSTRLRIPFHDGVISQFDGYDRLRELDWDAYRKRYGNIERLDLILQAEGDSTNRYKVSKQADVLMLFYLLSAEELRGVFRRLGYKLPREMIPRTVQYYLARTSHGSTLSRLTHGWVVARTDRAKSWSLFEQVLAADLQDTQGGTTREGVHIGAMAGSTDMVMRCYGGVETRDDALWLHPRLPAEVDQASFQIVYRGQPVEVTLQQRRARLRLLPCSVQPIQTCVEGIEKTLSPGEVWEIALSA